MSNWICSECGRDRAMVNAARPSIDDRYAVGYCEGCTPEPKPDPNDPQKTKPRNRAVVPLVRADVWDPAVLAARRKTARIHRLFNGNGTRTADEIAEMAAIRRQWEADAEARRLATPSAASKGA